MTDVTLLVDINIIIKNNLNAGTEMSKLKYLHSILF